MMQVGVESSYVIDAALREGILKFSEDLEEVKSMVRCFRVACVSLCSVCSCQMNIVTKRFTGRLIS